MRFALKAVRTLRLSFVMGVAVFLTGIAALAVAVNANKDIPYVASGSPSQKLDIYLPQNSVGPFPVVVWIHGGGWLLGDKAANPPVNDVSSRGWALVSINHRTPIEAKYPAQLHDCKAAIRFLRANAKQFNIDPNRIAIWGESSGGHLALLLGTTGNIKDLEGTVGGNTEYSSAVQGAINWGGPSDLSTIAQQAKTPGQIYISSRGGQVTALLGAYAPENQDLARNASPVTFASPQDAPMLLVHGQNDEIIPTQQSVDAAQKFQAAGAPVQLQIVPTKHDVSTAANRRMALDFFSACFAGNVTASSLSSSTPFVMPPPSAPSFGGSLSPSSLFPSLGSSTPGGAPSGLLSSPFVIKHTQKLEKVINQVTGAPPGTSTNQILQLINSKKNILDSKPVQWLDKQLK